MTPELGDNAIVGRCARWLRDGCALRLPLCAGRRIAPLLGGEQIEQLVDRQVHQSFLLFVEGAFVPMPQCQARDEIDHQIDRYAGRRQ
jgi:hypothetical protein